MRKTIKEIKTDLNNARNAILEIDHRSSDITILQAKAEVAIEKLLKVLNTRQSEILNDN